MAFLPTGHFASCHSGCDLTFVNLNSLFEALPVAKSNLGSFGADASGPHKSWLK
jgi:hypothetical protein